MTYKDLLGNARQDMRVLERWISQHEVDENRHTVYVTDSPNRINLYSPRAYSTIFPVCRSRQILPAGSVTRVPHRSTEESVADSGGGEERVKCRARRVAGHTDITELP